MAESAGSDPVHTAVIEGGHPGFTDEAAADMRFNFPSVRRFLRIHRARCPGVPPSLQAWSASTTAAMDPKSMLEFLTIQCDDTMNVRLQ